MKPRIQTSQSTVRLAVGDPLPQAGEGTKGVGTRPVFLVLKQSLLCLLTSSLLMSFVGCGGYGKVTPTAYEYSKALYSIANRKAVDKLGPICEQIESAKTKGELTEQEAGWLLAIAGDARDGNWKSAMKNSRRMMEDQVH